MADTKPTYRETAHAELERVRAEFHHLLDGASPADMRRPTQGTKWNNRELLFHMLFGYLILPALLRLVHLLHRFPRASKAYARALNAAKSPFDVVNYLGSRFGSRVYGPARMGRKFDRVIKRLHRRLDAESDADLAEGMYYPTDWDPFFKEFMTAADIYRYPTQHFDFHARQLTLGGED